LNLGEEVLNLGEVLGEGLSVDTNVLESLGPIKEKKWVINKFFS